MAHERLLLARLGRSPWIMWLPRVLPITMLGTFVLTLGLCYHFYHEYDASGRMSGKLYSISTYSVGPWDPSSGRGAPNLVIFRVGMALIMTQGLLLVALRLVLLLHAAPQARRSRARRCMRCILVGLSALMSVAGLACLLGTSAVTFYDDFELHTNLAVATYILLPASQLVELIAFSTHVPLPSQ